MTRRRRTRHTSRGSASRFAWPSASGRGRSGRSRTAGHAGRPRGPARGARSDHAGPFSTDGLVGRRQPEAPVPEREPAARTPSTGRSRRRVTGLAHPASGSATRSMWPRTSRACRSSSWRSRRAFGPLLGAFLGHDVAIKHDFFVIWLTSTTPQIVEVDDKSPGGYMVGDPAGDGKFQPPYKGGLRDVKGLVNIRVKGTFPLGNNWAPLGLGTVTLPDDWAKLCGRACVRQRAAGTRWRGTSTTACRGPDTACARRPVPAASGDCAVVHGRWRRPLRRQRLCRVPVTWQRMPWTTASALRADLQRGRTRRRKLLTPTLRPVLVPVRDSPGDRPVRSAA